MITPRVKKACILVILTLGMFGVLLGFGVVVPPDRVDVCGSLSPQEITEIGAVVHRDLSARRASLRHLPAAVRGCIPDWTHRIELLWAKPDGTVEVWYRGAEVKFYTAGKERKWGLACWGHLIKRHGGWTNEWASGSTNYTLFP